MFQNSYMLLDMVPVPPKKCNHRNIEFLRIHFLSWIELSILSGANNVLVPLLFCINKGEKQYKALFPESTVSCFLVQPFRASLGLISCFASPRGDRQSRSHALVLLHRRRTKETQPILLLPSRAVAWLFKTGRTSPWSGAKDYRRPFDPRGIHKGGTPGKRATTAIVPPPSWDPVPPVYHRIQSPPPSQPHGLPSEANQISITYKALLPFLTGSHSMGNGLSSPFFCYASLVKDVLSTTK